MFEEQTERLFEGQNDELVDELDSRVSLLRNLTLDINSEAKKGNQALEQLVRAA